MNTDTENALKTVFHPIYRANYPLDSIGSIQTLKRQFDGHPDLEQVSFRCESLISMIYFKNDLLEKSLEIDLKLLAENSPRYPSYDVILGTAIRNSATLNRMDEVAPYAIRFLKESQENFYGKLPVLAWYVSFYPNGDNGSFKDFEPILSEIVTQMGAEIKPSNSFIDRVDDLYLEFKRACKDLDLHSRSYMAATIAQGEELLKDYLATEPLSFYQNTAKLYRENRLKSSNSEK